MRQDLTDITLVLDRSGSMEQIRDDTIGGVNRFIREQRAVPGRAVFSLAQFDHLYEPQYEAKTIQDVPLLTTETFVPRGVTALLDAIGRTIVLTGNRLSGMAEDQRPGKVIFVIMTDGLENSSKEYTNARIQEMITHQREQYRWEFVFLGANQDAIATASAMGIQASNSITYAANKMGSQAVYQSLSHNVAKFRTGAVRSMAFSDEDREAQEDASRWSK